MNVLQRWLWQWSRRQDRQRRAKLWHETGDVELCLPQETMELLETQDEIAPFWKAVLLSISDRVSVLLYTQTVTTNALMMSLRDTHPHASGEEFAAIMSALIQQAELATQKRELEDLLKR